MITTDKKIISIRVPEFFKNKKWNGTVCFFRPSDSSQDRKYLLNTNDEDVLVVKASDLIPGFFLIKTEISCEGKDYYFESELKIPK